MEKRKRTIIKMVIICALSLSAVCVFGQDVCWYMLDGEKVCYKVSETKFLIKSETLGINDIKSELQNTIAGSLKEIEDWGKRFGFGDRLYMVEMQHTSKENLQELRLQWAAREDVVYTSPVFGDKEDAGYSNEILVRLKSEDDYPVLQKYAEMYQIKSIEDSGMMYVQKLTLPHNSQDDPMQIALELYETGLFVFAVANLIYPIYLCDSCADPNHNTLPYKGSGAGLIYPNPANEVLFVDLDKIVHPHNKAIVFYDIQLYSSTGNMLRQMKAKSGIVELNVSNLPNGIYFLHICDGFSTTLESFKVFVKH